MSDTDKLRGDIYGDISKREEDGASPLIPAATVVLLRQNGDTPMEVLMLQKNTNISFGGMWVFPGGRIDPEDYQGGDDVQVAAITAAVRETEEETGLQVSSDAFHWFSHWTPPASAPKRFATWFYAADANHASKVTVDGQEILSHRWITPDDAISHHDKGEIELVPPTWMTLHLLRQFDDVNGALGHFAKTQARVYQTRVVKSQDGQRVAMWDGDAGYASWDADVAGERHRLLLNKDGFVLQNTVIDEY